MTPEYILRKSTCRPPSCPENNRWGTLAEQQESAIEDMHSAPAYAEKGYSNPAKGILFADWNRFPRGVDTLLENYGYAIEWSDEWSFCDDCGNAFRTAADSYGWQPSFVNLGGEDCWQAVCLECLKGQEEEYLETLEGNPRTALNISSIDPSDFDYQCVKEDFRHEICSSHNDNPVKIFEDLQQKGYTRLLFRIDDVGQFASGFSVWEKIKETEEDDNE